ncbi:MULTISPECIES: prolipoprotein diacylglyceryl transferase [Corynebacterium]|uniref:prolipoprotein diacylglyceryl transferase n=1 Tax=Corynebacterium TaxID=1716 RepID=UPI0006686915|nr:MULTISPECIES: prolipoprotein diacylglyceryl transferase [Corynebacterium]KAA9224637.1 prolipoprotein diacylglyceryl transferase [Corynebacterium amycolatum]MDK6442697.1 prolipoprotein diacylglyceryl transferase [Corynebacterium amycolatum]OFN35681.1 prolipoprotein diacylglyceryl transferase [Corynebacterium sp. HMSC077G07]
MSSTLVLAETATTYLANIPSPPQGVWQLGPLPLRGYAISILVGVLVGIYWMQRRYAARGGDPELVLDIAIAVIPAGIIGGRLYHVATDWEKYFGLGANPADALKITNGGLGIWGAVALGVLAAWAVAKWRKVPFAPVLDAAAPAIILGQAIGRLGNWFNQELYGGPTSLPWGLEIYQRVDEFGRVAPVTGTSTGEVLAVVHPTFLYEMVWNVLACLVIVWADRKFKMGGGRVFALYVAAYTLGRFFIELMRVDDATLIFGVRINNITSLVVFFCAVIALWILRSKSRETAAEVRGEREAAEAHSASN